MIGRKINLPVETTRRTGFAPWQITRPATKRSPVFPGISPELCGQSPKCPWPGRESRVLLSYKMKTMNEYHSDETRPDNREDWFRQHARRNDEYFRIHAKRNHRFGGLFLLLIGVVLLMRESGVFFPYWFFTWPMILIAIGIFSGLRHGFRSFGWVIMILVGAAFLADEVLTGNNIKHFLWPALLVLFGLIMIFRPRRYCRSGRRYWNRQDWESRQPSSPVSPTAPDPGQSESRYSDRSDYIDSTAIFGGVEKIVLSKNFKGGTLTSIFGGTELNLLQADISQPVILDTTNIMGGTKLIVPASWDVQSEVVAIFGGIEDKRQVSSVPLDPNKVLVLKGTCFMGGIDIRSYV